MIIKFIDKYNNIIVYVLNNKNEWRFLFYSCEKIETTYICNNSGLLEM